MPKPTSFASHADLHQFARPPSRESSKSPRSLLQIAEPHAPGDRRPSRRNRPTALPDVTSSAEPVIVLDDDDTSTEHVFEPFERDEGAWKESAQNESARDTAAAATALSRSPFITGPAPVTSVVTAHATLLAVTSPPSSAFPSRVTLATTAAITKLIVRAATTVVTAAASTSRALTRSPSPNRPDSETWLPSSLIHPLVWASEPSTSSLYTSPLAPRGSSSSTASQSFTSPVTQLTSPSADFARPPGVIIPAEAAVAIVTEPTTYRVIINGGFTLNLALRLGVVDRTGVLADWRVQCDAPTLFIHDDPFYALVPEVTRRMPLKTCTEALRGLSQLLPRRYIAFYDRDAVLDALRLWLLLDRTTDIGQNIPICNSALYVGGTCWCRSRRTLIDLEMLWKPHLAGQVPDDLVDRARGIMQLFQRIADSIPRPKKDQVTSWVPGFEWFSRPYNVYDLATSVILEEGKSRFEERSRRVRQVPFGRLNHAPQPASPLYFRLTLTHDLDQLKLDASNRLLRIAPYFGLVLLVMVFECRLITEARQQALRREQTSRHLANDTMTHVYENAPAAPTREKQHCFYKTVNAFLSAYDDTLRACSRAAEWPDYE